MPPIRLTELLDGADDLKLVYGLMEMADEELLERRFWGAVPEFLRDVLALSQAVGCVMNGGFAYLLESAPQDPLQQLRAACERFGHDRGIAALDDVLAAFPGRTIPEAPEDRAPYIADADKVDDSAFYDIEVVPLLAGWLRHNPAHLEPFDRPVEVVPDPPPLAADAGAPAVAAWLQALSCETSPQHLIGKATIRSLTMAQYRHDLDRLYAALAAWPGLADVEALNVSRIRTRYWKPVPFDRFEGLERLEAWDSGITDAEIQAAVRLPKLRCVEVCRTSLTSESIRLLKEKIPAGELRL